MSRQPGVVATRPVRGVAPLLALITASPRRGEWPAAGQLDEQPGNWVIGNQPTADGVEQIILGVDVLRRSTVPLPWH